jgi:hypothetical protein
MFFLICCSFDESGYEVRLTDVLEDDGDVDGEIMLNSLDRNLVDTVAFVANGKLCVLFNNITDQLFSFDLKILFFAEYYFIFKNTMRE